MGNVVYINKLIYFILTVYSVESRTVNRILGLKDTLEQFGECNIDITAEFENTDFEPFPVPTILIDSKFKENSTFLLGMRNNSNLSRNMYVFKLREYKCGLDLFLCLDEDSVDVLQKYNYLIYRHTDFMNDKYLVIIRHRSEFQSDNLYTVWGMIRDLKDCRVFLWTVVNFSNTTNREVTDFLLQRLMYLSPLSYSPSDSGYPIHTFEMRHENSNIMSQMELFSNEIRKKLFWGPREKPSHLKLNRNIKLPFDEHLLNQDCTVSTNFQQFVINLLKRTNFSGAQDINGIAFHGFNQIHSIVADEADGFNFITCVSSDTFWSIAQLFLQPYQWPVWTGLAVVLVVNGIALVALKIIHMFKFSGTKLFSYVLFNLIEVGGNPGHIRGRESGLKILLGSWLLMSIVLTGSYKGLIISYLSTCWTPEQDYDYFLELKDFQFYSRVPELYEDNYWEVSKYRARLSEPEKTDYDRQLVIFTSLGLTVVQTELYVFHNTLIENFMKHLHAFAKNESKQVFDKLTSGGKAAIVGLNREIDEILFEISVLFPGIRFFRGQDNLWPQNQNWLFTKISYSQTKTELVQLMSSGIYQFWKYWIRDRKVVEAKLKEEATAFPGPLALKSNVSFTFVLLIFGFLIASSVFVAEIFCYGIRKYVQLRYR